MKYVMMYDGIWCTNRGALHQMFGGGGGPAGNVKIDQSNIIRFSKNGL